MVTPMLFDKTQILAYYEGGFLITPVLADTWFALAGHFALLIHFRLHRYLLTYRNEKMNIFKSILSGSVDLLNLPVFTFFDETVPGYELDHQNMLKDWKRICDDGVLATKATTKDIKNVNNGNK
jgi:hypothetical protein